MKKILFCVILLSLFDSCIWSQEVYYHVSNTSIYEFLDEMADLKIIELNSVIKPYSRKFIADKLMEIKNQENKLNKRQQKELGFYLKDFYKEIKAAQDFNKRFDLFFYKDSLFTISVNGILGIQYWSNNNDHYYHRWNGAGAFAYVGKHFGAYASLRDNHESDILSNPAWLDQQPGAAYKSGQDYSEMRGGLTYNWGWGTIGLIKDNMEWGNYVNYPNIISSKVPSLPQIIFKLKPAKWFEFSYFHAWLVSEVVDNSHSFIYTNAYGTSQRIVFQPKYMAANMYTFKPFKNFFFSFGNSIIYSDVNVQPAYLIPFLFFKSVDHQLGGNHGNQYGENSQMFFDFSSRQIKKLHLFLTYFLDDFSVHRIFNKNEQNFYSVKLGFSCADLIKNVTFDGEYLRTNPLVFKHNIPTTTYESNNYNLGHYLQDNSRELYLDMIYRPLRGLRIQLYYDLAQHGPDYTSLGTKRVGLPFMEYVDWERIMYGVKINYQVINDGFVFLYFMRSEVSGNEKKYTDPVYYGNTNTLSVGINFGF